MLGEPAEYPGPDFLVVVEGKAEDGVKNLGPVSRRWLAEVGVFTLSDLRKAGAVPVYRTLKNKYPRKVSLNLLWALAGALRGIDWRDLTPADKARLRRDAESG